MNIKCLLGAVAALSFSGLSGAQAQSDDVSFFVVGKTELYVQNLDGSLNPPSYYFFAEIFGTPDGELTSGSLHGPDGIELDFISSDRPNMIRVKRQDFESLSELNASFPNGVYKVSAKTPSGEIKSHAVSMTPRSQADIDRWSAAPVVSFSQNGKEVAADKIEPFTDLLIGWSDFERGRPDPKNILADPVFAMIRNCHGEWVARSTIPLEDTPSLDYADTQFRIPAERVMPGDTLSVIVEHAELVETNRVKEVVGLGAFPSITTAKAKVMGEAARACPAMEK